MDSTLAIIVTALLSSTIGPALLILITSRTRKKDKELDWERQDTVAARLEARQDAVKKQVQGAAELLLAANERVAEATRTTQALLHGTNGKIQEVHVLVNSQMTAVKEAELNALENGLVLLRQVIGLKEAAGLNAAAEDRASVTAVEEKIRVLKADLDDRAAQTAIAQAHESRAATKRNHGE